MSAITITDDGLNLLRDGATGANVPKITYVALGNATTPPTVNDHTLGNEIFRKAVTSYANGISAGEVLVNMYLGPNDAIGDDIEEVGFFGGSSATGLPNTGVLIAHGLFSHNPKSGSESIQFQLDFVI